MAKHNIGDNKGGLGGARTQRLATVQDHRR
jgi:hypothetical protein